MIKLPNFVKSVVLLVNYNSRSCDKSQSCTVFSNYSKALHTETANRFKEDVKEKQNSDNPLMDFGGEWPTEEMTHFKSHMKLFPDFISELEETQLYEEVQPYITRLRYEFDHWDDAIHGFRETERKHWYPHNRAVLQRVSQVGFKGKIMPYIHILDLAPEGVIKPHVDSTRYCGDTIAGLSLLSDAVMRLVRTNAKDHEKNKINQELDNYRSQPKTILENNFYVDILLPRRSLYIMSHTARYNFTHEILANEQSKFQGQPLTKVYRSNRAFLIYIYGLMLQPTATKWAKA